MEKLLRTIRTTRHYAVVILIGLVLSGYIAMSGNLVSAARILFYFLLIYLVLLARKHPDWGQLLVGGKVKIIIFFIIPLVILFSLVFLELRSLDNNKWMLSLYGGNITIMRLDYPSRESCLSAGRSYLADKSAERFDCGYRCTSLSRVNLQDSPLCEKICNDAGCR